MTYRRKLIEVALPLEEINIAARREKNPFTKNHPRSLHVWWARRPLTTCRAVIFASIVDDPSSRPEEFPTEKSQEIERKRLFGIIVELVKWENSNNELVLNKAKAEILKSTQGMPPALLDPFCGGGSIPLEAQRLGLKAYASDLNPVAVLITKAMIEIPPQFAGCSPVNSETRNSLQKGSAWYGTTGLSEDIRYYGQWLIHEANKRIGNYYPKGPNQELISAWIWARTVKCPNPACSIEMPLVRSFLLSSKKGKMAWVQPIIDAKVSSLTFVVRTDEGAPPEGTVNRRGAKCISCGSPVSFNYVRSEGKAGRIDVKLMAMVAETERGRTYLPPDDKHIAIASKAKPAWIPEAELPNNPRDFKTPNYGMHRFADLFSSRQLLALTSFAELVSEVRKKILGDALSSGMSNDHKPLCANGGGAHAYADAVTVYLGLAVSRFTDFSNAICSWDSGNTNMRQLFARQAIPMAWDFTETNPINGVVSVESAINWTRSSLMKLNADLSGTAKQLDAATAIDGISKPIVSTDPPYYDNIGYADLSDFFYIWLRKMLNGIYPDLFSTLLVPKSQELVAMPNRFGGDLDKAKSFFEEGLGKAFAQINQIHHPEFPFTVYYAFKQIESDDQNEQVNTASTGWETMLEGLLSAGFLVTGTWPVRTEQEQRSIASGSNALASSIVLVCRHRPATAPIATRREFISALKQDLPIALKTLQHGNIAPVDLAQASIGPGMAVFSRYSKVLEADGTSMGVRTALQIINQELDAYLTSQEGELDRDSRFCIAWFEQNGMGDGVFGSADVLARAKNTSVNGLVEAGVLFSKAGQVRLLKRTEYPEEYDPANDDRLTIWECTQHMIRALNESGEEGAAKLCARLGAGASESVRALAYRLYSICERKGLAEEALAYNSLITSWPAIQGRVPAIMTKANFKENLF